MLSPIHVCRLDSVGARAVHVLTNGTNRVGLTELTQKCELSHHPPVRGIFVPKIKCSGEQSVPFLRLSVSRGWFVFLSLVFLSLNSFRLEVWIPKIHHKV
jgi:hypothetical protein